MLGAQALACVEIPDIVRTCCDKGQRRGEGEHDSETREWTHGGSKGRVMDGRMDWVTEEIGKDRRKCVRSVSAGRDGDERRQPEWLDQNNKKTAQISGVVR